jgi:hypothetical protein
VTRTVERENNKVMAVGKLPLVKGAIRRSVVLKRLTRKEDNIFKVKKLLL